MDQILLQSLETLKRGEPLVVAALFCLVLALGFLLGKGTRHTGKLIHSKWQSRKAAQTEDLLK